MIFINMQKAKDIAHTARREKRETEFAPLDAAIMKQIPGTDIVSVEAQRQVIRDKYAVIQQQIDAATSVSELETLPIYQP